ncbi:MAG: CehA/McbA family metallohydrolase [Bacteroidales bacterium]|nr:CehA/McbA family metallohydrolase [Bacteroidales bacterium]
MKRSFTFYDGAFIALLSLMSSTVYAQHPSIGGYNVYYGHVHNHTSYSDGTGTPAQAYNYAKNTAGLDFFGLSDHSDWLTDAEWADTKARADAYNADGVFTTFYGFEWTNNNDGHVSVVNSNTYTTVVATSNFAALVNWLSTRNTVAFFCHPGRFDNNGENNYNAAVVPSLKIVGMELWNKLDGFSRYYYNTGFIPGDNKGTFDEALAKGWMIGAMGAGDDHNGTWGTAQDSRMAILAENLTRDDLFAAMKVRRFYSTLESDIRLSFKMNGQEMGSAIPAGSYAVQIQAADGGGEIFTKVVLYDKDHNRFKTWTPNTSSFTINYDITTSAGDYYYIKVLQADSSDFAGQAISSPVFITSMKIDGNQSIMIWPDSCVTLHGNVTGGIPPYAYKWTPATGLSSATATNPVACPATSTQYNVTVTDLSGCSVIKNVTVNINPLPYRAGIISGTETVCQGQNNVMYSVPAIAGATSYIWTLPSGANGTSETNSITLNYCTSAVSGNITVKGHNSYGDGDSSTLAVTVNPSFSFTENGSICEGDTFHWQGIDYTTAGIYTASYNSIHGCDSINTLHLTVNPVYSFSETDSICEGDTLHWQGTDYTASGIYIASYNSIQGCDSIYTLQLTVNPDYSFTEFHHICKGDTLHWYGLDYTATGIYTASYKSIHGCDSVYTLHLTVNPVYSFTEYHPICEGDTFHWQGTDYTASGIYTVSYKSIYGCDSSYTLHLSVNPCYSLSENHTICVGDICNWQGNDYTAAGKYTASYKTINGCDSIYTLNLCLDSVDIGVTVTGYTITADSSADEYQWLDCDNGFAAISGKVNQSFTATTNGNYAVKITQGLCSDTSACVQIIIIGNTSPLTTEGITLYPNPVYNELIIEKRENAKNLNFKILNTAGQVVFNGKLTERTVVQTNRFAPGVYFLKIENGKAYEFMKIEKE